MTTANMIASLCFPNVWILFASQVSFLGSFTGIFHLIPLTFIHTVPVENRVQLLLIKDSVTYERRVAAYVRTIYVITSTRSHVLPLKCERRITTCYAYDIYFSPKSTPFFSFPRSRDEYARTE